MIYYILCNKSTSCARISSAEFERLFGEAARALRKGRKHAAESLADVGIEIAGKDGVLTHAQQWKISDSHRIGGPYG